MRSINRFCLALTALVVAALVVPAMADGKKGTAVIKGKVVFDGKPPAMSGLPFSGNDAPICKSQNDNKNMPDQATIVYTKDGNAVPYVFVSIKKGITDKYDAPTTPIIIDQHGCMYHPHVQGMICGQPIDVKNSDPVNHNIHSLPKKNKEFNFAQPNKGMVKELRGSDTFNKPEMVKVKCDVHGWMASYIGVVPHPFFSVTKDHEAAPKGKESERGTFEIKDVPAGEYEIEFWHETFGVVTQTVSVKDGETKDLGEVKIGSKKAAAPVFHEVSLASAAPETGKSCCQQHSSAAKN